MAILSRDGRDVAFRQACKVFSALCSSIIGESACFIVLHLLLALPKSLPA